MSNEELIAILDKYDSRSQTNPNYYSENEVLSAMREACEVEAKKFAEYAAKTIVGEADNIIWHLKEKEYTTSQLYLQYKTKTS